MKVTVYNIQLIGFADMYGYYKDYLSNRAKAILANDLLNLGLEPLPVVEAPEDAESYCSYKFFELKTGTQTITAAQLLALTVNGIEFKFINEVHIDIDPVEVFKEVADKQQMQLTLPDYQGGNTYNNKCEVHMPGNLMASFNEVQLLEDACSDVLQTSLTSGWSLIAACPQPNQRRPDYILGRFNANKEVGDSAAR